MDKLNFLKSSDARIYFGKLCFKPIDPHSVSAHYMDWMNDQSIVQFTEQRFCRTLLSDVIAYVKRMNDSEQNLMYGIYDGQMHIGNIKLSEINAWHKTANVSYLLGSKSHWGKGYATIAVSEMVKIGFFDLGLKKICAGVYANNVGSSRVLEKNNFKLEGVRKDQFVFKGGRVDLLMYGKFNEQDDEK